MKDGTKASDDVTVEVTYGEPDPMGFDPDDPDLTDIIEQLGNIAHAAESDRDTAAESLKYWQEQFDNHDARAKKYRAAIERLRK